MPKYRNVRRRRYKRRRSATSYMDKASKGLYVAGKALTLARIVKGLVNVEKKHFDTDLTSLTIDDSGGTANLAQIPQGDGNSNRDGNSVRVKSVHVRVKFTQGSSASSTLVKCALVKDLNASGGLPAMSAVYDGTDPEDMLNLANSSRYQILRSKTFMLNQYIGDEKVIDWFVNVDDKLNYVDGTTAPPDNVNYFLAYCADENTAGYKPTSRGQARIRYIDN